MKLVKIQNLSVAILIVAGACSSPRHFTDFNNYSFQAEKKKSAIAKLETASTIEVDPAQLTASTAATPIIFPAEVKANNILEHKTSLSRSQVKELKREVKAEVKRAVSTAKKLEPASTQAAQAMDKDLKLALIFGIVGVVLGGLFGISEILAFAGAVAIIVALVFLIKWLVRQ
jgi:F0F1-type ATP synthase assembly protein I